MLSLSKHGGQGLCARPFDKLRVTGLRTRIKMQQPHLRIQIYEVFKTS
jgi:hypothetical protein